jgi:hypothetical protein
MPKRNGSPASSSAHQCANLIGVFGNQFQFTSDRCSNRTHDNQNKIYPQPKYQIDNLVERLNLPTGNMPTKWLPHNLKEHEERGIAWIDK